MLPQVNEKLFNELNHFYNKLDNVLTREKIRLYKKSIFFTLIKMPPNRISKLLSDAALSNRAFYDADLRELMNDGFICEVSDIEKKHEYCITALGIWTIETQLNKIDISQLIHFFQDTKFSSGVGEKPLSNIEKIVLTSMIAIRNFSIETAMDLNEKSKSDYWIDIYTEASQYLSSNGYINKSNWLPSRAGNEHPVNFVMRRAQDLPQKTKHVYETAGNNRYYLDMITVDEDRKIKLKFLFLMIFEEVKSKTEINNIHSFLCKAAYDHGKNVRESFEYINPEWDSVIEDALDDFYYDQ